MTQFLDLIVSLQGAVDELQDLDRRLEGVPDSMREIHEEHSARKAEIDAFEASLETIAAERREAEGVITEERAKEEKYQAQLTQVTTQREYGALLHEIDAAKEQARDQEELIREGAEKRESVQAELTAAEEGFAELDRRYTEEMKGWEAKKPDLARQAKTLRKRVEELRGQIPRQYLSQYDRIAERFGGQALAPIRQLERPSKKGTIWHCGACNYNVRPQVVVEISSSGSFILCDSCKRILFRPEEEEQAD